MAISSVLNCIEPDQMEAAHVASRAEVVPIARERPVSVKVVAA